MLRKIFSLLILGTFLISVLPVRVFPMEGTKQSVETQKSEKPVVQIRYEPAKSLLAKQKSLIMKKPEKTLRKWYISAGIIVAAGIVSYYRLQPNSPLDRRW